MDQLKEWTVKELSKLRSYAMNTRPITKTDSEIADFLINKKDESFIESYVNKFFGNTTATKSFVTEFLRKKRAIKSDTSLQKPYASAVAPKGMTVLHSKKDDFEATPKKTAQKSKANANRNQKQQQQQQQKKESGPKTQCDCFGTIHKALTNCLNCGRIVCEKEGYGPCSFCGCPVTKEISGTDPYANSKDAEKAIELKNRLIKYDKTAAKRTTIYDDQEDYFTTSPWLSKEEIKSREEKAKQRELEKLKREEFKKKTFISFNFGGQVVSVVTGSEIDKKKEEEEKEREGEEGGNVPKKKTYDSSDSDDDDDDDDNDNNDHIDNVDTTEANDDDDGDDEYDDTEFIKNEEFCPMKPKNVPFGAASNLSIAAPVYHESSRPKSEGTTQKGDNDPFSNMNDKDHRNRVQHDYFAD